MDILPAAKTPTGGVKNIPGFCISASCFYL